MKYIVNEILNFCGTKSKFSIIYEK